MPERSHILSAILLCLVLGATHMSHAQGGGRVVVRAIDDLIEWTVRSAPKVSNRTDNATTVLEQTLRRMRVAGDNIAPELASFLQRHFDDVPMAVFRDDTLLRFLSRQPEHIETSIDIARRHPVADLGRRLELILDECHIHGPDILRSIARSLPEEQGAILLRGISGRELSPSQIESLVDAMRASAGDQAAAEMFEIVARVQLSHGTMAGRVPLKQGTKVINGQYSSRHGIDGIGVDPDGVPLIFEFTISRQKNLSQTRQLSPDWVATRWNRMLEAQPGKVEQLRNMGVRDEFLQAIDPATAAQWHRKLVAPSDGPLTEANRLAAGLDMNDLLVLKR